MKFYLTTLFISISIFSLYSQSIHQSPYAHLSDKELFKQEVLEKEAITLQQNNWKKEFNDAGGNRSEGVMLTIIGFGVGLGGSSYYITSTINGETPTVGIAILLLGSLSTVSGIIIISKSNKTRNRILSEFRNEFNKTHFEKVDSQIELQTKGSGLGLTYSF